MDKRCGTCKYDELVCDNYPCSDCKGDYSNWESAEKGGIDMVNNPPHYTHGKYECIDVMVETFGKEAVQHFCLLNAFKYVWRSEYKNGTQDIKKAMWYLDKWLELEGEKHDN